eukprot:252116_1
MRNQKRPDSPETSVSLTEFPRPNSAPNSNGAPQSLIASMFGMKGDNDEKKVNSGGVGQIVRNLRRSGKKFWMSDKNCESCDECGTAFNIFYRRHHCRICGRIFCDACSANYIGGEGYGIKGKMRACNYCFSLAVKDRSDGGRMHYLEISSSTRFSGADSIDSKSPDPDSVMSCSDRIVFPSTKKKTSFDSDTESSVSACELHQVPRAAPPTDPIQLEVISPADPIQLEALSAGVGSAGSVGSSTAELDSQSSVVSRGILSQQSPNCEQSQRRINDVHFRHLNAVVEKLLEVGQLGPEWKETIVSLAQRATDTVEPQVKCGDQIDIRHYVKIKKIAGGSIQDCCYVDGVVFRKNIAHRKMKRRILKPRILLLSCALEFQRISGRLCSLDTLIKQEKEYIEIMVAKIQALKPSIVVVQRSVCRLAQELIR